ncbi:MAG: response regulator, partial [Planctomycetota bacterium]
GFESANSHLLKTLGYRSASLLIDRDHEGVLPWHAPDSFEGKLIQAAFDKGQTITDLESLLNFGDQALWLLESLVPVRDEQGRLLNWLGTVHDITERKEQLLEKIEVAEARSKAKGEFLANMSHEIRTPLNGVIGMMDLLAVSDVDEKQAHYLGIARSSAELLLSVINDILDFSKIEAGKLEIDCIDFDLRETVETTVEQFAVRAHEKQLEMNCELDPMLPYRTEGDPDRLRQILVNLLGNALKFTESGEVNLRVTRGDDSIRFSVQDTGIGMNQEVQSRLFESFMQADGSTTRRYGGTGLGLAISSELVRQMGGEIQVRSEEGVGTEFWFEIQLPVLQERSESSGHSMLTQFSGCRVLVVDDNSTNCEILSTQLTSWGFEAQVCQKPTTVVQRLLVAEQLNKSTDLIILDYCMPEMDGRDVAIAVRREPALAHIPIVILSSNHELLSREELSALGIQATMTKPARQSRLLDTLMSAFESHSKRMPMEASAAAIGAASVRRPQSITNVPTEVAPPTSIPRRAPAHPQLPPVSATEATQPTTASEPLLPANSAGLTANVLVAEDNEVNQMVATQMLSNLGLSAELACNGEEAFEKFQNNRYELILMDGHMPVMDGQTATKAIRAWEESAMEEDPTRGRTAIVALTANVLAGFREECLEIGMDDYLIKPITMERLSEVTNKYCTRIVHDTRRPTTSAPPARRAATPPVTEARRIEPKIATPLDLATEDNPAVVTPDLRPASFAAQPPSNYPAPRRITKDGRGRQLAPESHDPHPARRGSAVPDHAVSADKTMSACESASSFDSQASGQPTAANEVPNAAEPKLLDSQALSERCCGDPEFERQILGIMQSNLNDRLQEITQAFDEGDIERLTAVSHRLKGAAADSALCAVQNVASNLEARSLEGELDEVPALIATLSQRVEQTLETVNAYCSQLDRSSS